MLSEILKSLSVDMKVSSPPHTKNIPSSQGKRVHFKAIEFVSEDPSTEGTRRNRSKKEVFGESYRKLTWEYERHKSEHPEDIAVT